VSIGPAPDEWLAQVVEPVLDPDRVIVDPHHHFWDDRPGTASYMLDDLLADTSSGHRVAKTVFLQVGWRYRAEGPEHLRPVGETEAVAELVESNRSSETDVAGIVGFADLSCLDTLDETLDAHRTAGRGRFRGIRQSVAYDADVPLGGTSHPPADFMQHADFRAGIRRLGRLGMPFETFVFHTQLRQLAALANAVPECTIVLDHLGAPLIVGPYVGRRDELLVQWRLDMAELARRPNVVVKLGGLGFPWFGLGFETRTVPPTSEELAGVWGEPVRHVIECFGAERCMFESNFPVDKASVSYRTLWNACKRIAADASESEKEALFRGTASRVYALEEV
jgi:predicted TIM-barrel fold metal-dependent hydrolase